MHIKSKGTDSIKKKDTPHENFTLGQLTGNHSVI